MTRSNNLLKAMAFKTFLRIMINLRPKFYYE